MAVGEWPVAVVGCSPHLAVALQHAIWLAVPRFGSRQSRSVSSLGLVASKSDGTPFCFRYPCPSWFKQDGLANSLLKLTRSGSRCRLNEARPHHKDPADLAATAAARILDPSSHLLSPSWHNIDTPHRCNHISILDSSHWWLADNPEANRSFPIPADITTSPTNSNRKPNVPTSPWGGPSPGKTAGSHGNTAQNGAYQRRGAACHGTTLPTQLKTGKGNTADPSHGTRLPSICRIALPSPHLIVRASPSTGSRSCPNSGTASLANAGRPVVPAAASDWAHHVRENRDSAPSPERQILPPSLQTSRREGQPWAADVRPISLARNTLCRCGQTANCSATAETGAELLGTTNWLPR
jgi:hypothetical protein